RISAVSPQPWSPRFLHFLPRVRKYSSIPKAAVVDGFSVTYPRYLSLPAGRLFSLYGFFLYLQCRKVLRQLVEKEKIDLIHAHTALPDGFAAVLLGKEFKLPVVCTAHGSDIKFAPYRSWAARKAAVWTLQRVQRVIAVSVDLRKAILGL